MAKILVAASPEPRAILERVLAGHELFRAETMAQAEQFLVERTFDLIICTIVFDESKMFDFLRHAKSRPESQRIPFVCARVREATFSARRQRSRPRRLPARPWEAKHSWTSRIIMWAQNEKCATP